MNKAPTPTNTQPAAPSPALNEAAITVKGSLLAMVDAEVARMNAAMSGSGNTPCTRQEALYAIILRACAPFTPKDGAPAAAPPPHPVVTPAADAKEFVVKRVLPIIRAMAAQGIGAVDVTARELIASVPGAPVTDYAARGVATALSRGTKRGPLCASHAGYKLNQESDHGAAIVWRLYLRGTEMPPAIVVGAEALRKAAGAK